MKSSKKFLLGFALLMLLLVVSRNWLYWHLLCYQSIGTRAEYSLKSPALRDYLDHNLPQSTLVSPQVVLRKALQLSAQKLHFTAQRNDLDPNLLINSQSAHCVGYAHFTTTLCNELLKKYQLANEWEAESQIGQIYFMGVNLHLYFKSPFFKDHDFVVLRNRKSGTVLAADPTVYDYLGVTFIRMKR